MALAGLGVGLAVAYGPESTDDAGTATTMPTADGGALPAEDAGQVGGAGEVEGAADPIDNAIDNPIDDPIDDPIDNDAAADGSGVDDAAEGGVDPAVMLDAETGDGTAECVVEARSMGVGAAGSSVRCLQAALAAAGFYGGPIDGEYGGSTAQAVERFQTERRLFIDGIAGRETSLALGIWPAEPMTVVRTPIPPPGATDDLGYRLSSVAVAGADAPALPQNSGSGRRVVYERQSQRVWAVDENERVVRSWLVAGSRFTNEVPGTHRVYSRSESSIAWDGTYRFNKMVRWFDGERGALGFHSIPFDAAGRPQMTEAELGERLSAGCQRQADLDADFLWDFAPVGTTVVVL